MENIAVLKLDSAFTPIEVVSWQEAVVLTWLNKAYAVEYSNKWVHSATQSFSHLVIHYHTHSLFFSSLYRTFFVNNKCFYYIPRSSEAYFIVNYYIKWVTPSWTYSMFNSDTNGSDAYGIVVQLIILYCRPPDKFRPITQEEKHGLFER